MSFVKDRIAAVATSPLLRSTDDYIRLLNRVRQEARRQKAHARAWELAKRQGVRPIDRIEDLKGDFWPEEETADEFLAWLNDLRGADNARGLPE